MDRQPGRPPLHDTAAETAAVAIRGLARRADALDIALHTIEVSVGGEIVASAACAPRGPHVPQRMYSVSKTVTGLAVGLLAAEGALHLDDPIIRHFPEMAPVHPWLEATTIRHLLAMRGPHRATTFELTAGDWLESYFGVPPTHPPGTLFTYDTSGSYVLAALVERLAGIPLPDYLRPRLLDPIGVDPGLRFLTGPEGIAHGGSGLICTPRDLLRLAHLLLDDGTPGGGPGGGTTDGAPGDGTPGGGTPGGSGPDGSGPGRSSLIPAAYLRDATRRQADTSQLTWGETLRTGYGYQLWLPARGGWLMFGLGGQIVYGDPARHLAVVVTADAQACGSGDQRLLDEVMDALVAPLTAVIDAGRTPGSPHTVALDWPAPRHDASTLPDVGGTFKNVADGPGPAELLLSLHDDGGRLRAMRHRGDGWDIEFRFDQPVRTRIAGRPAVVTAGHSGPGTLDVRCALHGDDLTTWRLRLVRAAGGSLAVQSQAFGESVAPSWTFHATYLIANHSGGS
ncbi:serine hydrolase domain-containing protein [Myceligenerans xiligouense]|uniref:CubicO group peptidase (Beta-lactamase class C family) n=1 Tax=Myceligenerans xiligouense TaxID=253184 RepID=A0A3N4YIE1_9MICO|nr:serine hydrolase [Myceligenerans xiligouense]RPF19877.1 CubicO group peptidase (beta-lactamase class C family) [Myceligenerans xiligouense]